jgi:hypothetical protein
MPDGTEREDRANAACQCRALDTFPSKLTAVPKKLCCFSGEFIFEQ